MSTRCNSVAAGTVAALALCIVAWLPSTSFATITIGDPNDAVVDLVYNPANGDVTLDTKGPNIQGFDLLSAGHQFIPANANLGSDNGFKIQSTAELANVQFTSSLYFPNGYDLGQVFPPGLSASSLTTDLTFSYTLPGHGILNGALLVTPEPSGCLLLILGGAALAAAFWRRRPDCSPAIPHSPSRTRSADD